MKLIVGLGNPGKQYVKTRHNVGFMALDELSSKLKDTNWINDKRFNAEIVKADMGNNKAIIVKPMTFVNESGRAVKAVSEYYNIYSSDIIVISDDINLSVGDVRVRIGGSDGGHNGLKSIIANLSEDFWRIRVGVGINENEPSEKYVLKHLSSTEVKEFDDIIDKVADYLVNLDFSNIKEETLTIK